MKIEIFTDGACSGNPGRGGYGILMRAPEQGVEKTFSAGFRKTTNNRMELLAVIIALEQMKSDGHDIHIFTDSKYVADAINKNWISGWVRKGFKNVKNPDLWQRLLPLLKKHNPQFHWVKGHAGHRENEICDRLAVKAASAPAPGTDHFFEQSLQQGLF